MLASSGKVAEAEEKAAVAAAAVVPEAVILGERMSQRLSCRHAHTTISWITELSAKECLNSSTPA